MTTGESDRGGVPRPPDGSGETIDSGNVDGFPIVGVGASAGGLGAFTEFLNALPLDSGMAFVLIQHLSPEHGSALPEILGRATGMPVTAVQGDTAVQPDHVYVIPPARSMMISDGTLQLFPRELRGAPRPVDQFFRSLAQDRGHRAIGVVLSGTASDGTLGLAAIKGEGGITFAQDESAEYSGMPRSAIDAGCVDFVLNAQEIAREVVRIGNHPYATRPRPASMSEASQVEPDELDELLKLLHRDSGVDFTDYKFNTLYRRIARRMMLQKTEDLDQYMALVRSQPAELEALYRDILINVTSFFRDPPVFESLKSRVFPGLIKDRSRHDPLRIWVIGCSTGEEAYSLAMAWAEFAEAANSRVRLQLFATDLSEASIATARAAVYPPDVAQDVSAERLRRFFVEIDGRYRINKELRELCIFSRHNVLTDPPFSRIDLISCRNVMIYWERALHQQVVPRLHYALKPGGFLCLGGSETIGAFRNLFEPEDASHRIYARKASGPSRSGHSAMQVVSASRAMSGPAGSSPAGDAQELHREADRLLLSKFVPPSVVVTPTLEILQYRGRTRPYLSPSPGKASLNLLKMLRESLVGGVRAAILRAEKEKVPVRQENLLVESDDSGYRSVAVEVHPLSGARGGSGGGFLIVFDTTGQPTAQALAATPGSPADIQASARMARELADTREFLQALSEQHDAAHEELQSANEEAQSANEELQSINEELETSKEELQSSNEELATVNDELNNRNAELSRVNNDLENLLGSIRVPIVMLGPDLRIRRLTPAAEKLLRLTPHDVGRAIGTIRLGFDIPDLESLLSQVIDTASPHERDVRDADGHWYSMRLRPYRTLENEIDGAVMLLVDVDLIKRANEFTRSIVRIVPEPLLVLDSGLRVRTANDAFYRTFAVTPQQTEGRLVYEMSNGQWNIPALRRLLEEPLPDDVGLNDVEMEKEFEHVGSKTILANARRFVPGAGEEALILLGIQDITERKQAETRLRQYAAELTANDRHRTEFLAMLAHELRNPLGPIRNSLHNLRRKRSEPDAMDSAANMIERQVGEMVRLVDDLLDISRISRGTIELRRRPFPLAPLLEQVIEAVRPSLSSKNLELNASLPAEPVLLNGDPTRMMQVVGNLLNNACKFSERNGRVDLTLSRDASEAVISVRDNGIGIAAAHLPRVFDMFMQVDTSLERSVHGLGIGLTMVKRLAELHGGTVEARSDGIGRGSEFLVRLPAMEEAGDIRSEPAVEAPAPMPSRRILVVDDNSDAASSLAQLLEISGHEVHIASDGLEAVEAAARLRPEVVLLDIGLPGLNGYEACRRIRETSSGRSMMIVALTGWGQEADRKRSSDAGFDFHLVKPVEYQALMTTLASLPGRKGIDQGRSA